MKVMLNELGQCNDEDCLSCGKFGEHFDMTFPPLLKVMITIALMCAFFAFASVAWGVDFTEDFTSADGAVAGYNGWYATEACSAGNTVNIVSNVAVDHGNNSNDCAVANDIGGFDVGDTVTFEVRVDSWVSGGWFNFTLLSTGANRSRGYGMFCSYDGVLYVMDNNTPVATGSCSVAVDTDYTVEMIRTENGMELRVWETSGSRPSTPTLEHDNGSTFTPSSSGTSIGFDYASNDGGSDVYFDNISVVSEGTPTPTPSDSPSSVATVSADTNAGMALGVMFLFLSSFVVMIFALRNGR